MRAGLIAACAGGLVAGATAACGDNSDACGVGTRNDNGTCTASACGPGTTYVIADNACVPDGSVVCTQGTVFDLQTGACVVDPSACPAGTVLYDSQCVNPDAELPIDVEEGPEPNGYGIIEQSTNPAGAILLKPVGGVPFVIHGKIAPFRDVTGPGGVPDGQLDPDADTYLLEVAGPTMIRVRADGLGGIDGGFVAVDKVSPGDPMAQWQRFGIDVTNASSERQVFLPTPGTYLITIADTRTLFEFATGGPVLAAPGGPNGDYYIVVDQLSVPTPTPVALAGGSATVTGQLSDQVAFYAAPMGSGSNAFAVTSQSVMMQPALVVLDDSALAADLETGAGSVGGFGAGSRAVIAVDDLYDYAASPVPFTLSVTTGN